MSSPSLYFNTISFVLNLVVFIFILEGFSVKKVLPVRGSKSIVEIVEKFLVVAPAFALLSLKLGDDFFLPALTRSVSLFLLHRFNVSPPAVTLSRLFLFYPEFAGAVVYFNFIFVLPPPSSPTARMHADFESFTYTNRTRIHPAAYTGKVFQWYLRTYMHIIEIEN